MTFSSAQQQNRMLQDIYLVSSQCVELGVLISEAKTFGPEKSMVLLGIGIDLKNKQLYLNKRRCRNWMDLEKANQKGERNSKAWLVLYPFYRK